MRKKRMRLARVLKAKRGSQSHPARLSALEALKEAWARAAPAERQEFLLSICME
jgi:hypothetical protein